MFQSNTAEVAVCEHCRSVVVRKDVNVEAIGKMAVLPADTSPLQIGTTGTAAGGLGFTLLGRVRVAWEGGSWNEWFIEFGDHTRGWLAEAQGFFMVLRETPVKEVQLEQEWQKQFKAGQTVAINGVSYRVTDSKPVKCLGGDGELPDAVVTGEEWQSTDVEGDGGVVGSLEFADGAWRFFEGTNSAFPSLGFQNLRAVPGWNGVPPLLVKNKTDAMSCPTCGGVINLHAAGQTMTATCSHCGTLLDTSTPTLQVAQKAAKARSVTPFIPVGTRGKFDDVEWEMIGFMLRRDSGSSWTEYLLFNPSLGFRWLVEFQGNWTIVDRLLEMPAGGTYYQGRSYRMYADENTEVTYVEGEFYWQVRRGEKSKVTDFISPPYILSREFYPELNEISWSAGEYISAEAVQQAFGLSKAKGAYDGTIGAIQPNPYRERWGSLRKIFLMAVAALIITQCATMRSGAGTSYTHQFTFDKMAAAALSTSAGGITSGEMVTEPFQINKQGGVDISVNAAVDNAWLGLDLDLINQTTGEHFPTDLTVEYYHGYDSDGSWTEGSQTAHASVPGVPPGTYTLAMEAEADPSIMKMPYTVKVQGGQTYWSNFFLCGFALLVWPIYNRMRAFAFEVKRWSASDYSPYASSSSSDDD
jgi:hypothetical protein